MADVHGYGDDPEAVHQNQNQKGIYSILTRSNDRPPTLALNILKAFKMDISLDVEQKLSPIVYGET